VDDFRHEEPTLAEARAAAEWLTGGYWTTQVVYVMAKLGLADQLAEGPRTVDALAAATGAHAPTLSRLLRALAGLGLVREGADGRFEATKLGRCFATGTPGSLRGRAILSGETFYTAWGALLHSVRTGLPAFDHQFGAPSYEYLGRHPDIAAVFNETMASATSLAAEALAAAHDFGGATSVVDVGGGTGALLTRILRANPHLRGVLFDLPEVALAAEGLLSDAGVEERCRVVAGDFFADELPPGGDVYVLSWIIHNWDDERSVALLRNCRRAMADDARLLLVERVLPPGDEPSPVALWDLHMLVMTTGRERTEEEFRVLLAAADLELTNVVGTDGPRCVIEASPR
jgi:SAM-dependent methyltransferase/DNA-binding transcriptional ArsR family regulator